MMTYEHYNIFLVTYAVDARPNDWERKLKKWGDTAPTLQAFTGSGKNALKEPEDVWLGVGEKGVVLIDKVYKQSTFLRTWKCHHDMSSPSPPIMSLHVTVM